MPFNIVYTDEQLEEINKDVLVELYRKSIDRSKSAESGGILFEDIEEVIKTIKKTYPAITRFLLHTTEYYDGGDYGKEEYPELVINGYREPTEDEKAFRRKKILEYVKIQLKIKQERLWCEIKRAEEQLTIDHEKVRQKLVNLKLELDETNKMLDHDVHGRPI